MTFSKPPVEEEVQGKIKEGLEKLKANPAAYDGIYYQSNMVNFPEDYQRYTLVKRTGSGISVQAQTGGPLTFVQAKYQVLDPIKDIVKDSYTDSMTYQNYPLAEPQLPGRGRGCADVPSLKIIGDVDPGDIRQGGVGDCWLLSAISALAEFDGAVHKLFAKTSHQDMPKNTANRYTITLYDLPTWSPVDIVVDERLCSKADGSGLLGSCPSVDGELWVCYLEKAIAAHCGGWDKIDGGTCTHAWALLTGNKYQYTISDDGDGFHCMGTLNPMTAEWEMLANSPHDGFRGVWPMAWPKVGGGGSIDLKIDENEMFERMCAWDDNNFIMGCGTKPGSDTQKTDGIVDGHAYSILSCINNAGGTNFDMIKVRNPWGQGEFDAGQWIDNGPGWRQHPEVKDACKPVIADDGVFWCSKEEFFKYFKTIFVSAMDVRIPAEIDVTKSQSPTL